VSDSAIVIKMLSAGVCGTDLAILSGHRAGGADILGHEGVGFVVYAPDYCGVAKGARVIINPVHRKRPVTVIGHNRDGVFREFFWVDVTDALDGALLVPCSQKCSLSDAELVLAEPLASVLYSFELLRERTRAAGSLLILGAGTVGILAAKLWSRLTGRLAILVSKSEAHARWLRESTHWPPSALVCGTAELRRIIHDYCGGNELKVAILCCSRESAPDSLDWLLDVVAEGALIDLMAGFAPGAVEARLGDVAVDAIRWRNVCGVSPSPPTAVVDRSSGKSFYLIGHRGTAKRHIVQAVELLCRGIISIADVPHRLLDLEQLPGAVSEMLSTQTRHDTKWVKGIVKFSS
jgi:threonine dehydrogenase-like Zn-dependent dehydrogenase